MKWNLLILFDTYTTEDSTNVLMSPLVNLNTRTYNIPKFDAGSEQGDRTLRKSMITASTGKKVKW